MVTERRRLGVATGSLLIVECYNATCNSNGTQVRPPLTDKASSLIRRSHPASSAIRWLASTTTRTTRHGRAERSSSVIRPVAAFCWSPSPSALGSSDSLAPDVQRDTNVRTMNKRRGSRNRHEVGLAREYRFDYSKSRPNRFARQVAKNAVVVVLDPDVAAVFRDPKKVNSLLRATIAALKKPGSRRAG